MTQPVLLRRGGLTDRVYAVIRYKVISQDLIEAVEKHDVTAEFNALMEPQSENPLTDREMEVLALVAEGKTNVAIGRALNLSHLTIKSHLARIARKLDTGDRAGMVGVAFRAGYLR